MSVCVCVYMLAEKLFIQIVLFLKMNMYSGASGEIWINVLFFDRVYIIIVIISGRIHIYDWRMNFNSNT